MTVVPGDWNRVKTLGRGSRLVITMRNGDRVEADFTSLETDVLLLTDSAGGAFSIPRPQVQRIIGVGSGDGLTNGALIGAGIGLGAALAILAGLGSGDGYVLPSAKWGAPLLLSSAGGLIGALVDRARKSERLLYVAP